MADDIVQNIQLGGADQISTDLQNLARAGQEAFKKIADAADRLSKIEFKQFDSLKSKVDDTARSADKASDSFKNLEKSGVDAGKNIAGTWDGVSGSIAKAGLVINGIKSILDLIPGIVSNAAKEIAKISTPGDLATQKLKAFVETTTAAINLQFQGRKAALQAANDELSVESALANYRKVKADRQSTSLEKRQAEAALDAAELRQEENQARAFLERKKAELELIEARKKAAAEHEKVLGKHRDDAKRPYSSEEKTNLKDYTKATEELGKAFTYIQTKVGALLAPISTQKAKWLSSALDDSAKLLNDLTEIIKRKDIIVKEPEKKVYGQVIKSKNNFPFDLEDRLDEKGRIPLVGGNAPWDILNPLWDTGIPDTKFTPEPGKFPFDTPREAPPLPESSKFDQIFEKIEAFGKKQGSDTLVTAIKIAKEVSLDLAKVWESVLLPAAKGLVEALDSLTETFNKTFGTDFSKSGLLVLGVVTSLIGGFTSLGIAVAAVFSSAHTPDLDNFRKKLKDFGFDVDYIKEKFGKVRDYITDLFSGKKDASGATPFENIKSGLKDFGVDLEHIKDTVKEFVSGDKGLKTLFSGEDESGKKVSAFQRLLNIIKEFPIASAIAAAALIKITGAGASLEQVLIGAAAALNIVSNLVAVIANFPLTALIAGFVLLVAYGGDFVKILGLAEKAFNALASVFNAFTENLSRLTGLEFLKTAITGVDALKAALIGLAVVVATRVVPAIIAGFSLLYRHPIIAAITALIAGAAALGIIKSDISFPEKQGQNKNTRTVGETTESKNFVTQESSSKAAGQGTSVFGEKFDYSKEQDPVKRYFENLGRYWESSLNSIVKAFDNLSDKIAQSIIDSIDQTIEAIKTKWQSLIDYILSFIPGSNNKESLPTKEITPQDINKNIERRRKGVSGESGGADFSESGSGPGGSSKLVDSVYKVDSSITAEKDAVSSGFDKVVAKISDLISLLKSKTLTVNVNTNTTGGENNKPEQQSVPLVRDNTLGVGLSGRSSSFMSDVTPSSNIEDRRPRDSEGNILQTAPGYYDRNLKVPRINGINDHLFNEGSLVDKLVKLAGPYPQSNTPSISEGKIYTGNSVKDEAVFKGRDAKLDEAISKLTITIQQANQQQRTTGYSGGIGPETKILGPDPDYFKRFIQQRLKNFREINDEGTIKGSSGGFGGLGSGGPAPWSGGGLGSGGPAPWSGGGLGSGGKNLWQSSGLEEGLSELTSKIASVADALGTLTSDADEAAGALGRVDDKASSESASAASGGFVSGPGTATSDSIPARLSNGEFVVRASAVRNVGVGFMHAINNFANGGFVSNLATHMGGVLPRFAVGGPVGAMAGHSSGLHPVTINFGSHSVSGLLAPRNVVAEMRSAAISTQVSSTGRKPSHYR